MSSLYYVVKNVKKWISSVDTLGDRVTRYFSKQIESELPRLKQLIKRNIIQGRREWPEFSPWRMSVNQNPGLYRTGDLYNSVKIIKTRSGGKVEAAGPTAPYGMLHELGTGDLPGSIPARPFIKPALQKWKDTSPLVRMISHLVPQNRFVRMGP